ncbi:hypothetical protein [Sulfuracidifex tepidarius]|uniref:CRISPR-associated protein n=1 Tax=Sulfuracidifex tepidarius TaxID=1294262 RepID=A0A510E5S6_9CREN|nr:hypothetical protein [Sulfuracidifex tepidarius]BBG27854.1 Putative CRISPR-associated protein [Sulfuracidifex tepidarius]
MAEIKLPPMGYLARDLTVSALLETGASFKIKGDIAELENVGNLEDVLKKFRETRSASLVKKSSSKFKKQTSYILEEDAGKVVEDFFNDDKEDYSYTLLLPELMEAERWYGGWNGGGKKKKSIEISKQSALLAWIALGLFTVFHYRVKKTDVIGIAPVDTIMEYQACRNLISEERIKARNIDKLSHMGRVFLFAMHYSDNVCQKLVVLKLSNHRGEIIEDDTFGSIEPIIRVWKNVNSKDEKDKERYLRLLNDQKLVDDHSSTDVFNKIANYVFEAVSGSVSPEQVAYFIARDTYLKDEAFGFITPRMVKRLKEGISLAVKQRLYSP